MGETEQSTELADLRVTSEWARAATVGLRNDGRIRLCAVFATTAAVGLALVAIVRPTTLRLDLAVVMASVAAALWSAFMARRRGPWSALRKTREEWLLAMTQLEALEAAATAYAIATLSTHVSADPLESLERKARELGAPLTDAQRDVIRQRARTLVEAVQNDADGAPLAPTLKAAIARLESAHASAKVRLKMLDEAYRERDEGLARGHRFARTEIDADLRSARAQLQHVKQQVVDAIAYPENHQVPTSDIGVSAQSIRNAVDAGMLDARNRRVASQPALMHASLSERARWSVQSPNAGLTRELLELFEPISRRGPASDDAPSPAAADPPAPSKPPTGS